MAKGAGYRKAYAVTISTTFKRRLPSMLSDEGRSWLELHTGLADKTPMTDRGGLSFNQQIDNLRKRLDTAGEAGRDRRRALRRRSARAPRGFALPRASTPSRP